MGGGEAGRGGALLRAVRWAHPAGRLQVRRRDLQRAGAGVDGRQGAVPQDRRDRVRGRRDERRLGRHHEGHRVCDGGRGRGRQPRGRGRGRRRARSRRQAQAAARRHGSPRARVHADQGRGATGGGRGGHEGGQDRRRVPQGARRGGLPPLRLPPRGGPGADGGRRTGRGAPGSSAARLRGDDDVPRARALLLVCEPEQGGARVRMGGLPGGRRARHRRGQPVLRDAGARDARARRRARDHSQVCADRSRPLPAPPRRDGAQPRHARAQAGAGCARTGRRGGRAARRRGR